MIEWIIAGAVAISLIEDAIRFRTINPIVAWNRQKEFQKFADEKGW